MSSQTRKIKQDELRRLMNEQKKKLMCNVKKIESPLARYDKDGTLHCVLCQTIVRSEAVWNVHINCKRHKENVANRLKNKEEPPQAVQNHPVLKRPAPPPPLPVCTKKVKSILKNAPATPNYITPINSLDDEANDKKKSEPDAVKENNIQDDSSDSGDEPEDTIKSDVLPEGFFDDPKLDAKVRNVEYKDPIEEEWEQFQKEIKEETSKAQQIIAEDQEEATNERQIDEIDEQMRNWTRVVSLEKKKKEVIGAPVVKMEAVKQEESSGEEDDFEEFLDWRSKKSFV